ncbi:MAG: hypothetical protein US94_C0013G0008 [Berkelbacteria bacterium GW2011_GWB1_38_5]|uniref:PI3K/PI4K catalytic domain-containing protein n=1 Tax=Berkelbacteria bacterium GW2011_GWB1_38_5 TaxID=1618336 RepID=A0A0G0K374_9BACT|nr:MAG: hypothetical protein US94_C0013G0008 [Berkelbacteria bacterium GW2011_GWB1_38_5]
MSETIPLTNPEQGEVKPPFDSRFGNIDRLTEIMREGEVVEMGRIEDIYPEVVEHANVVDIVDIPAFEKFQHANEVLGVKIQKDGEILRFVFKPADGESQESKKEFEVKEFSPHEYAAFQVSEHFGLDIVPPTIIREINGRVGALQLFLDHDYYQTASKAGLLKEGDDYYRIAILDWLLINCERHKENMMLRKDDPAQMAAIDHGVILSSADYGDKALRGPSALLTEDGEGKPRQVTIPQDLIDKVNSGFSHQEELTDSLSQLSDITPEEIAAMWKRAGHLIKYGVFLSKYNFKQVADRSWLSDYYENPNDQK